jgi:hypothetical protein
MKPCCRDCLRRNRPRQRRPGLSGVSYKLREPTQTGIQKAPPSVAVGRGRVFRQPRWAFGYPAIRSQSRFVAQFVTRHRLNIVRCQRALGHSLGECVSSVHFVSEGSVSFSIRVAYPNSPLGCRDQLHKVAMIKRTLSALCFLLADRIQESRQTCVARPGQPDARCLVHFF